MSSYGVNMILFVLFSLLLSVCCESDGQVKSLTKAEYSKLSSTQGTQVIHFTTGGNKPSDIDYEFEVRSIEGSENDDHAVKIFHKQYTKSAIALAFYNVQLYTVDCEKEKIKEYCMIDKVQHNVYIFRDGTELLNLGLDSMFDVDAIVSNILQIVLLREVPILQTAKERQEFENRYKGDHDIVFSFQMAIGTRDHRILMEVAYKYHHMYKFAITTEKKTAQGLPGIPKRDKSAIWVLQCKDHSNPGQPCTVAQYYNRMTMDLISQFMEDAALPNVHKLQNGEDTTQLFPNTQLKPVYVLFDDDSSPFVQDEARAAAKKYQGSIGVVLVNINHVQSEFDHLLKDHHIPALAFEYSASKLVFMPEADEPDDFIRGQLLKLISSESSESSLGGQDSVDEGYESDDEYTKYLSEVERQDDEVAMAMSRFRGKYMTDDSLMALTDKTFPTETHDPDFLLVIFYLPFDAMSSAMHRSFVMAADLLVEQKRSNPLASVNCYDWTDVCGRENVTTWPTLRVYRKGHSVKTHKMIITPDNILQAVTLFQIPAPMELSSVEELSKIKQETSSAIVLALSKNQYVAGSKIVSDVASELHGSIVVYLATGEVANEISRKDGVPMSSFIVYKKHDEFQPVVMTTLEDHSTTEDFVQWIKQASINIFTELTPTNLPTLYAKKQPLVIYFTEAPSSEAPSSEAPSSEAPSSETPSSEAPSSEASSIRSNTILGTLAVTKEFSNIIFTWMDKSKMATQQIMMAYSGDNVNDVLALVDLNKGIVFVYSDDKTDEESIQRWLKAILAHEIEPSNTLPKGEWKPKVPPYNFLKMMDDEKSNSESESEQMISHDLSEREDIQGSDIGESKEEVYRGLDRTHPEVNDDLYLSPEDMDAFQKKHGLDADSFTLSDEHFQDLQKTIRERKEMTKQQTQTMDSMDLKHAEL